MGKEGVPASSSSANNAVWARNLSKSNLGGVVFGCKNSTMKECLSKQLFGLPALHFSYVKNIDPGLPLFLFNYSDRKLHGIFEAASSGQININPYGWTTDGSERTLYPAQVQVRVRLQCKPLLENQFKPIIDDNYYNPNHFWFELDHAQTNRLMSLLTSFTVAPGAPGPLNAANRRHSFRALPLQESEDEGERYRSLGSEMEYSTHSSQRSESTDFSCSLDGDNQPSEAQLYIKMVDEDEKNDIFMKLTELAINREKQVFPLTSNEEDDHLTVEEAASEKNEEVPGSTSECQSTIAKLIQEVEELKAFKIEQSYKMVQLEQKLVKAEVEIQQLKSQFLLLDSAPMIAHVDETFLESSEELQFDIDGSIFLMGGYTGETYLSALDSYDPSRDVIKSLKPMSFVRAHASSAWLSGELYVFGGGDGHGWYNTVESYSLQNDQWTLRPSLNEKRGSLAGATIDNKLFAFGGGNGVECLSNVEMFDLDLGRWISTRSMQEKRFCLAAAELNGVLYATGGYDGINYLKSAEKFDPREHSWTRIASLNVERGCHSLVVLNEKLYAFGGFDGGTMVSSIEIYDPRLGSWIPGEPMKNSRGYLAAVALDDSICVMGGLKFGDNFEETVAIYKEGQGWQEKKSRVIGKRCYLSAIV